MLRLRSLVARSRLSSPALPVLSVTDPDEASYRGCGPSNLPSASLQRRHFAPPKKGKNKDKKVAFQQPHSGKKHGHGADDRPSRLDQRLAENEKRIAALAAKGASEDELHTDDEEMQVLYDMYNKGALDYLDESAGQQEPVWGKDDEELWQRRDAVSHATYSHAYQIPDEMKADARLVDVGTDAEAETDQDLSEDAFSTGDDEETRAMWAKRKGAEVPDPGANLPGRDASIKLRRQLLEEGLSGRSIYSAAEAARSLGHKFDDEELEAFAQRFGASAKSVDDLGEVAAAPSKKGERAKGSLGLLATSGTSDSGSETETATSGAALTDELEDVLGDIADLDLSDLDQLSLKRRPDLLDKHNLVLDSENDELMEAPPLRKRRSFFEEDAQYNVRGATSRSEARDAQLSDEAQRLMAASGIAPGVTGAVGDSPIGGSAVPREFVDLQGDDSSDWGGDDFDFRFSQSPTLALRRFRERHRLLPLSDPSVQDLLDVGVDDETGTRLGGIMGDGAETIPEQVLREYGTPYDFEDHALQPLYPEAATAREASMTPEERITDEHRKKLRNLIDRPLPVPNRPLWPTFGLIAAMDQVRQVVKGGTIDSTRCCIVVGNGVGGAGFGIASHVDPASAAKQALFNAKRDMIHVSTHKGQLYHDLIGKKNSVYCIIRTMPSSTPVCNAPDLIQDVFEMTGIQHASAKIIGSKRRNPYIVVQALFDAFNHHIPPEDEAFTRGLRMQWMGANRHNPRNVYPFSASGPRYPPANSRGIIHGRARA